MLLSFLLFSLFTKMNSNEDIYNHCDSINQPICQSLMYTKTKMPNLAGIMTQSDAAKRMNDYLPLINIRCSQYFRFFLCTVHFPMCAEVGTTVTTLPPCQKLCLHVKSKCEPFMKAFKLSWPKELTCEKLPVNGSLCVDPKVYDLDRNRSSEPVDIEALKNNYYRLQNEPFREQTEFCSNGFVAISKNLKKVSFESCQPLCSANIWYNSGDKKLASVWLGVWSILGLISTLVAAMIFIFDSQSRFRYPERPIVFIVICYGCISVIKVLELSLGREKIICHSSPFGLPYSVIVRNGLEGPWCTVSFLGTYYFEMVAALWWLMLAVSCYLASARKWSWEGVERVSNIMHMVSWSIPAVPATMALILHKIDADELLGNCYIGRQNSKSNLIFILLPRILFFTLGSILLIISFRCLLVLRTSIVNNALTVWLDTLKNQQSLDKFIAKTGIFCGVYGVPMVCYIGCQMYYYMNIDQWNGFFEYKNKYCFGNAGYRRTEKNCGQQIDLPLIEIRLLEIFSSLVLGITSAMWMWCNKKTLTTIKKFIVMKCFCQKKPMEAIHLGLLNNKGNDNCLPSGHSDSQLHNSPPKNPDLNLYKPPIVICSV